MKRIVSLLLCVLLAAALPASALAAQPDSDTINISTAGDLLRLAESCTADSWSRNKTVRLLADVDLSGTDFWGIPLFAGRFDGNGHTIRGLCMDQSASTTGLFRQVLEGGTVENLTVSGTVTPGGIAAVIGGIAGENHGLIRGCAFVGTVKGSRCVGGIAGLNGPTGTIESCSVRGTAAGEHRVGGITGENHGSVVASISRAAVNTEVPDSVVPEQLDLSLSAEELLDITDVGGIAGFSAGTLRDCINEGSVGYPHVGYNIGGIAGRQSGDTTGCSNRGSVFGRKDVGGIAGQLEPDAGWSYLPEGLGTLRTQLDELQRRIDMLADDAAAQKLAVSSELSAVLAALERTGDAADALTGGITDWVNGSLDTVNDLSARVTVLIDGLSPLCGDLARSAASLAAAAERFSAVCRSLRVGMEAAQPAGDALDAALAHTDAALRSVQAASASVTDGLEHLKQGIGDPAALQTGLAKLTGAMDALAGSVRSLHDGVQGAAQALANAIGSYDPAADTPEVLLLNLLNELEAALPALGDDLSAAGAALSALADAAGDLTVQPDPAALSAALTDLRNALLRARTATEQFRLLGLDLRTAGSALADAAPAVSRALGQLAETADGLSNAFSFLFNAGKSADNLLSRLTGQPALSFPTLDREHSLSDGLFSSLDELRTALEQMTGTVSNTVLLNNLRAVSDQLFVVMELLISRVDGSDQARLEDYVEDISDGAADHRAGAVALCRNQGDIAADTNAGGVVGAVSIELSFDREDTLNLSALLSSGAKYLIFAQVSDCVNISSVSAKKESAGGIVGRMDCGAVTDCQSSGAITSDGNNAGGIAGYCLGTLRGCFVRANLSAAAYLGGIAGSGRDIYDCLAMPGYSDRVEYQGAIAGFADGTISGNYYADCAVGGVNGFSFEGQAQALPYEHLVEQSGELDIFRTITVTFLADGEVAEVQTIPFGGRVETMPELPMQGDRFWKWDAFDNTAIYRSITVEGQYLSPITVISTEETPPLYLVEGTFYEGQSLTVLPFAPDAAALGVEKDTILASDRLLVSDYEAQLTVRMRAEESGQLYAIRPEGGAEAISFRRDGSYIVFQLDNGGAFAYVRQPASRLPLLAAAAGGLGLAGLAAAGILRRKKRSAPIQTEQQD